jgi:hypothetical protein
MIEAMKGNRVVRMVYAWKGQKAREILLEPDVVKVREQRWYVTGKSDAVGEFALEGIRELEVMEEGFVVPEGVKAGSAMTECDIAE